jgi:hypothetical protein
MAMFYNFRAARGVAALFAITIMAMTSTAQARVHGTLAALAANVDDGPAAASLQIALPAPAVMIAPEAVQLSVLVSSFSGKVDMDSASTCLAKAVYFEARGETLEGQLAVADVVLNRANSGLYPVNVCDVVTQKSQFSFIRRGRFPKVNKGSEGWSKAVAIAHIARNNLARSVATSALWYHADYVSPRWGRWHTQVARIGAHIFYS